MEIGALRALSTYSELSPAPEFRGISRIREFSENSTENSTEFLCYFQNWSKTLQKASECYQNLGKAPEIAQNFYIFVKSTQKSSRKAPEFLAALSSSRRLVVCRSVGRSVRRSVRRPL